MNTNLRENEAYYYRVIMPEVHKGLREMRRADKEEWRTRRTAFLEELIKLYEPFIASCEEDYEQLAREDYPYWQRKDFGEEILRHKARLEGLRAEAHALARGKEAEGVTDTEIEIARHYPIERLLEVDRRGYALCINPEHNDRHPSMCCKNNYAFCFSCGFQADTIKIVQLTEALGFADAVRRLNETF